MQHVLKVARPVAALAPAVRVFAQREYSRGLDRIVEPVPAKLEPVLEFQFGDPYSVILENGARVEAAGINVIGPQTHRRAGVELVGAIESFGIFFRPAGVWRIFGVRIGDLTNGAHPAEIVLGHGIASLWHRLADAATFDARVALAQDFLVRRLVSSAVDDPIATAADRILQTRGATSVAVIAGTAGLSLRQFERRFRATTGMAPKYFSRIARFQYALDLRISKPNITWTEIAHRTGYHDQMHLIHDFHSFAGMSPGRTFDQIGDQRPPAWHRDDE